MSCARLLPLLLLVGVTRSLAAEKPVVFSRDVRPILAAKCFRCHSSFKEEAGLKLDSSAAITKGGDSGAIVVAGKSAESRLLLAVRRTGEIKMPPEGEPLSNAQSELIRRWIDEGAKLPSDDELPPHWSFTPPTRPAAPELSQDTWSRNSIDRFIAAKLQEAGIAPLAEAPRHLLVRRLYLDLIGLPPTAAQTEAFVADNAPNAYENLVDRLLNSSAYGERWGRHWMDVWRYSDWDGYGNEVRESQPHIWRWRDWIIESLNADKPYNEMVVEMLAGDELAPDDPRTLRATGYLVRSWYKFNRNIWLDSAIEHTGKAFLGLTFNCARCHDHMYDPISQAEYYRVRAIFEPYDIRTDRVPGQADTTKDGLVRVFDKNPAAETFVFVRGDEKQPDKERKMTAGLPKLFRGAEIQPDALTLPVAAYYPGAQAFVREDTLAAAKAEVAKVEAALAAEKKKAAESEAAAKDADGKADAAAKGALAISLAEKTLATAQANVAAVEARIAAELAAIGSPPAADAKTLALAASRAERDATLALAEQNVLVAEQKLADAKRALKPDDEKLKKAVTDAEAALPKAVKVRDDAKANLEKPSETYTKFGPQFPTTSTGRRLAFARWAASADNPLAARVAINHIWLRHFHSPLVPTVFDFGINGKSPSHPELLDWLATELVANDWRMKHIHRLIVTSATYRLDSGAARSSIDIAKHKAVDPDNRLLWRQNSHRLEAEMVRDATLHVAGQLDHTMYGADIDPAKGATLPRRSVYFRNSKEKKMTFLSLFDSPNPVECYRRSESVAPQQALAMANSGLTLSQSRLLAGVLSSRVGAGASADEPFVHAVFGEILGRAATTDELRECQEFLVAQAGRFENLKAMTPFVSAGDAAVKPAADPRQRARENLVHVLLNHNDFVTVR